MVNKVAVAGLVFFTIVLAGFVGIKVEQTTVALLGGAFIGLVVAIPTTALVMIIGLRKRVEPKAAPKAHPVTYAVYAPPTTPYDEMAKQLCSGFNITWGEACAAINEGRVQCLPMPKTSLAVKQPPIQGNHYRIVKKA